jgi:hypothetical protein
MKSVGIRGSVVAAVATIFVLGYGITTPAYAQQAALAANPELAAKGVWNGSTTYVIDDLVTSRGSTWRSKKNNNTGRVPGQTQPSTAAYWELFARGFNPSGAWSNAPTYQPDDMVTHSGQTYRAKITNTSKQPPHAASWELLAAQGATGPAGPNTGIEAGTVAAPSFSFTGDSGTGIYSPATGKIALVENGVQVLHTRGGNAALGWSALSAANPGQGNTAIGSGALNNNTSYYNTGVGANALYSNTDGLHNTAVGNSALATNSIGDGNAVLGKDAMYGNTQGDHNVAIGRDAMRVNTTGGYNVAIGVAALSQNNGSNNIAIGASAAYLAGFNTAPSINNSIYIGYNGSPTFSDTIKIGAFQTQTFIAGIAGVNVTGAAVQVDGNGQLGVVVSSRRYKDDVAPMGDVSAILQKLRPVTFHYKQPFSDGTKPLQYGLIAEEVAETLPDLAVLNKDGSAETVKYHLLPSFLLAGYQAQQNTIAAQADELRQQKEVNASLEARLTRIEALLPQTKAAALQ